MNIRVPGAVDRARSREEKVPDLQHIAQSADDEERGEQGREVHDRDRHDLDAIDAAHSLDDLSWPDAVYGLFRRARQLHDLVSELDAPQGIVRDERREERRHESRGDKPVDELPRRQREDVEADVVVEDRILGSETLPVESAGERQPRAGPHESHADGDQPCKQDAHTTQGARGVVPHELLVGDALEDLMPGGAATGELDRAVDDEEEEQCERGAEDGAVGHSPPEDRPHAQLAEPQPVDVESHEGLDGDDAHRDGDCRDEQAVGDTAAAAALLEPGR